MHKRLCFYGPTGTGKSTLAYFMRVNFGAEIIKIAHPLYQIQDALYETIGKTIQGQDGELLQFLALKIEQEQPGWLAEQFLKKVEKSDSRLIVNDDCRLNSYYALRNNEFIFIKVDTPAKLIAQRSRNDHISADPTHEVELGFEQFTPSFVIDNSGSKEDSYNQLRSILQEILEGDGGWLTGTKIRQEVCAERITITPFDESCLNSNSYNYKLSSSLLRITSPILDCRTKDEYETIFIPETGYVLQPNECYLGSTEETFGSNCYASLITGRSSLGRKFVTNHISAGLIDQGFFGTITLEITVQKPTRVYAGMKFGQIFWFTTFGLPTLYSGKYQKQDGPTISKLHLH